MASVFPDTMSLVDVHGLGYVPSMARLPRIIIPNIPHHVTQRGNRRQQTFFSDMDYQFYRKNLFILSSSYDVTIEAYCLMPNHVHLVLTPPCRDSLISCISELHQRYTRYVNFKNDWRGHLWQGRFYSVALSPEHFHACIQYVEDNAVRAKLVPERSAYKWQSHRCKNDVAIASPLIKELRDMTRTGRPRGDESFLSLAQDVSGIDPRPKKAGRKPAIIRNRLGGP